MRQLVSTSMTSHFYDDNMTEIFVVRQQTSDQLHTTGGVLTGERQHYKTDSMLSHISWSSRL